MVYWSCREKPTLGLLFLLTAATSLQDLADRMSMDMHKVCSKVDQGIGILILHGTEDETIPVEDANSLAAELPKSKLKIIEGGNHSFTEETHAKQVIGYAVEFLAAGQ